MSALYKIDELLNSLDENMKITESEKDNLCIDDIKQMMQSFVDERDWHKYHTPRNLLLALMGEIGELSEIFQWKGEVERGCPLFTDKERVHLGEEMADVLLYFVRLADVCKVNLTKAVLDKMEKNKQKYPKEKVKGSSKKYTHYKT